MFAVEAEVCGLGVTESILGCFVGVCPSPSTKSNFRLLFVVSSAGGESTATDGTREGVMLAFEAEGCVLGGAASVFGFGVLRLAGRFVYSAFLLMLSKLFQ